MAFPPNYNQERNNRTRTKAKKALDRQLKREGKATARKSERPTELQQPPAIATDRERK